MDSRVETLIREVRRNPCLYAKSTADYSNKTKRANAWREISRIVNMTENVAMCKWRSLRDRYVRECHKNPDCEPKWAYANRLHFLKQFVGPRRDKWVAEKPKYQISIDTREDHEYTQDTPYLYENTVDADCMDYNIIKGEDEDTQDSQQELEFHNSLVSNPLAPEHESEQETNDCSTEKKQSTSIEEACVSIMGRMTYLQEKWLETKTIKHNGFFQMAAEKLEKLPYHEQEDAKMLFLNYLHTKVKKHK